MAPELYDIASPLDTPRLKQDTPPGTQCEEKWLEELVKRLAKEGLDLQDLPRADSDEFGTLLGELGFASALERARARKAVRYLQLQEQLQQQDAASQGSMRLAVGNLDNICMPVRASVGRGRQEEGSAAPDEGWSVASTAASEDSSSPSAPSALSTTPAGSPQQQTMLACTGEHDCPREVMIATLASCAGEASPVSPTGLPRTGQQPERQLSRRTAVRLRSDGAIGSAQQRTASLTQRCEVRVAAPVPAPALRGAAPPVQLMHLNTQAPVLAGARPGQIVLPATPRGQSCGRMSPRTPAAPFPGCVSTPRGIATPSPRCFVSSRQPQAVAPVRSASATRLVSRGDSTATVRVLLPAEGLSRVTPAQPPPGANIGSPSKCKVNAPPPSSSSAKFTFQAHYVLTSL